MDNSKFNASFNLSTNNGQLSASETPIRIMYSGTPEDEEFIEDEQLLIFPSPDGSNSRINGESGSLVRPEEVIIVSGVLILWISVIALFIHKWGKIRGLEPYIPHFDRTSLHTHPSTGTNQVSGVLSGTSISSTAINVPPAGVNAIGHGMSNCNGTNLPNDQLAMPAATASGDAFASTCSNNSSKYFTTNPPVTSVSKNKWPSSNLKSTDHRRRCYTSANSVSRSSNINNSSSNNNNNSNNNNLPAKVSNGRRISLDPDLVGCVMHSQGNALGRASFLSTGRRTSHGHLSSTRAAGSGGENSVASKSPIGKKLYPATRQSKSSSRIHQSSREYFYPYSHRKPRASIDSSTITPSHMVQFSLDSPVLSSQALAQYKVNCTSGDGSGSRPRESQSEKEASYLNHKKIHPQLHASPGGGVTPPDESDEGEDDQLETSHLLCNSTESKCIYHSARSLTQGKEHTTKTFNGTRPNESRPFYSPCMSDRLDRTLYRLVDQRIDQQRRAHKSAAREYRSYIDIPSLVLLRMAMSEPNIAESRFDS